MRDTNENRSRLLGEKPSFTLKPMFTYVFGDTAKNVVSMVSNTLLAKFTYSVGLSEIKHQILPAVLLKHFKNIPADEGWIVCGDTSKIGSRSSQNITKKPGSYCDITNYHGVMITLTVQVPEDKPYDALMTLSVIGKKHTSTLNQFIKHLIKQSSRMRDKQASDQIQVKSTLIRTDWNTVALEKRGWDNVFLPQKDRELIENSIHAFINRKAWYEEHHIPYHFGILLHGVGGTGKTSIIKSIVTEFDVAGFYIKDLDNLDFENLYTMIAYRDSSCPAVVICEDIDTASFTNTRERDVATKEETLDGDEFQISAKNKLGQFLNLIDGFNSPTNVIYVFTTNHIDDLDPALIRPGRIDLCLEVGYLTDETFDQFLNFHYGKRLPENVHVKDELTCSLLQIDVMRGMDYETFLSKYTKGD